MKIPISKLAAAFCVSFVLLLAACTAPAEQNTPDDTQSQTQETPKTENQNNQQPQGGMKNEDVEESYKTYPAEEGWMTYESLKNKIKFQYPINLQLELAKGLDSKNHLEKINFYDTNQNSIMSFIIENLSLKQLLDEVSLNIKINKQENLTINNQVWTILTGKNEFGEELKIALSELNNQISYKFILYPTSVMDMDIENFTQTIQSFKLTTN